MYCLSFCLGGIVHLFALFKFSKVKQLIKGNLVQIVLLGPGYISKPLIKSWKFYQSNLTLGINLDQIALDKLLGIRKFK